MIDKRDPTPVYFQIAKAIKDELGTKYKRGERLPSENELAEKYRVSRVTIRNALANLKAHNLIYTIHGKGTFVAPTNIEGMGGFAGFSAKCALRGIKVRSEILVQEIVSTVSESLIKKLQIKDVPKQKNGFLHLKRLRCADDYPSATENAYLPLDIFPGLEEFDFAENSLYDIFMNHYHVYPNWADYIMSAKILDPEEVQLFQQSQAIPAVVSFKIIVSTINQPIEYIESVYNEGYTFHISKYRLF